MSEEPRLEEQIVAQVVEAGLTSQLESVEAIAVDVHTDLGKIVQGQAQGISVTGQGLVVQPGVRVEELEVRTAGV
ncbi:MAG TPA: LmeA family phospholipid-binding protein, partial [Candidatus Obscuribacterales bacterium]